MRLVLLPLLLLAACGGDDEPVDTGDTVDPGPQAYTDTFVQTLISPIDILWVIDSSWDQGNAELTNDLLNSAFETLLLADPSWRIGVLDSAARSQTFGLIRSKFEAWPFPTTAFDLPAPGGESRPRDAIYTALDLRVDQGQNREFIRSDAYLYVIVYTDNEDASSEIDEPTFQQWLEDFQPSNSKRLSVITTPEQSGYWQGRTRDAPLIEVGAFRRAIEYAFRDAMDQRTSFTLTHTPLEKPETVSVVYREHATVYTLGTDYTYASDTRTLTFSEVVPPPDAEIVVEYTTDDEIEVVPETPEPE